MKNLFRNLLLLTSVLSLTLMFSCGDEDPDDEVILDPPTAVVDVQVNGADATSPADVEVGDSVSAALTIVAPGNFNVFRVTILNGSTTIGTLEYPRTQLDVDDFTDFDANIVIMNEIPDSLAGATITLEFEVVDDANETGTAADFVLTIDDGIETRTQLLFGAQGNAEPGFYNVVENERYSYANARDNSASVDFAYYWGQTNKSTIAAIDNAGLNQVYSAVSLPIEGVFAERNASRFVETDLTVEEYNAISTATELQNAAVFETGGTSSVAGLAAGDVIAYQLEEARGGSFGLIRIVSVDDTNGNGTITIEVKSQVEDEE